MKELNFFDQMRKLIANDNLNAVIRQLNGLLDNSPKLDEAILQSARFQDIRKQIRLGIVSNTEANLTKNQIRAGLLELLREMEEQGKQTEIAEEMNNATATMNQKAEKIYNINKIDKADFS